MEEIIEDTFESMEDDDLEEDADREIEKILFEVTKGTCVSSKSLLVIFFFFLLGQLGSVGDVGTTLPVNDVSILCIELLGTTNRLCQYPIVK